VLVQLLRVAGSFGGGWRGLGGNACGWCEGVRWYTVGSWNNKLRICVVCGSPVWGGCGLLVVWVFGVSALPCLLVYRLAGPGCCWGWWVLVPALWVWCGFVV
jgi:hypothetical protein